MHTPHKTGSPRQRHLDPLETPLLVSVPEAARLLGVGTTFGWAMVRNGEIPSVRLGRRVLVPRAALEQLAGAHRDQAPSDGPDSTLYAPMPVKERRIRDRPPRP
jgi:excisionase family DNA binding protein